jgi:hypothetical protein
MKLLLQAGMSWLAKVRPPTRPKLPQAATAAKRCLTKPTPLPVARGRVRIPASEDRNREKMMCIQGLCTWGQRGLLCHSHDMHIISDRDRVHHLCPVSGPERMRNLGMLITSAPETKTRPSPCGRSERSCRLLFPSAAPPLFYLTRPGVAL